LWASKAISYVKASKAANPNKPFFLYFAENAVHAPHNPRADFLAATKGKYDAGWDAIRQARYQKQISSGLIPANTTLPPHNPGIVTWSSLSSTQQKLYARQQEAYAAYVQTLDRSFGALYSYLQSSGQLDNTIIVFASDNGGSAEGGLQGNTINLLGTFTQGLNNLNLDVANEDLIGGPQTSPHYPVGWAEVSNTPFRGYKQQTVAGGRRVPLIVSWPGHIADNGSIRTQFTHVTDITPTLLDIAGIQQPATYKGIPTKPIEGTSFRYLLDSANPATAQEQHTQQYYELAGNRGYYLNDGSHAWYAVTQHTAGQPFKPSEWQLYDLNKDFSETNNLAPANPTVVAQLDSAFTTAGYAYQVFPLFQGSSAIATATQPSYLANRIQAKTFHTGDWAEQDDILPLISPFWNPYGSTAAGSVQTNGSYTINATVQYNTGNQGVIFAEGGEDQGLLLYIQNGQLTLENNAFGIITKLPSVPLTPGTLNISFNLTAASQTGDPSIITNGVINSGGLIAGGGTATLSVNGTPVANGVFSPWSVNLASGFGAPRDGFDVGLDRRSPVDWSLYKQYGTFPYTGTISQVTVTPAQAQP
jgi:arylsulfatase